MNDNNLNNGNNTNNSQLFSVDSFPSIDSTNNNLNNIGDSNKLENEIPKMSSNELNTSSMQAPPVEPKQEEKPNPVPAQEEKHEDFYKHTEEEPKVEVPVEEENKPLMSKEDSNKVLKGLLIGIVVLIIIGGIRIAWGSYGEDRKLYNERETEFKKKASEFLDDTKTHYLSDKVLCTASGSDVVSIKTDETVSPFGNKYDFTNSYVFIEYEPNDTSCNYEYYIYLTDGKYSTGLVDNPASSDEIESLSFKITKK